MNVTGGYQQHNKLMLGLFLWFVTPQFVKGYVVKFILSKLFHCIRLCQLQFHSDLLNFMVRLWISKIKD